MRILFLIGLIAAAVFAQVEVTPSPTVLHRVDATITLDGRLDESVWREVSSLPVVMYEPTFQGEPTERTEIRVRAPRRSEQATEGSNVSKRQYKSIHCGLSRSC